jgi:hypothetical protein
MQRRNDNKLAKKGMHLKAARHNHFTSATWQVESHTNATTAKPMSVSAYSLLNFEPDSCKCDSTDLLDWEGCALPRIRLPQGLAFNLVTLKQVMMAMEKYILEMAYEDCIMQCNKHLMVEASSAAASILCPNNTDANQAFGSKGLPYAGHVSLVQTNHSFSSCVGDLVY